MYFLLTKMIAFRLQLEQELENRTGNYMEGCFRVNLCGKCVFLISDSFHIFPMSYRALIGIRVHNLVVKFESLESNGVDLTSGLTTCQLCSDEVILLL